MRFKAIIGAQVYAIEVPEELLRDAAEFHTKLDRDMDRGWQMSRQFVGQPDRLQRCQIVADKLLTSLMNGNEATAMLMAGYIALRMPGAIGVDIDATGEMQNTELLYA
jgi:glucose-6-phosphate dehydrogenase assembly protein OpcA